MKDIYGNEMPIIEGHEQAFWILGAFIFLTLVYLGFKNHLKDVQRIIEERKPKPILRDFHDRDDPHQDHDNLGRH